MTCLECDGAWSACHPPVSQSTLHIERIGKAFPVHRVWSPVQQTLEGPTFVGFAPVRNTAFVGCQARGDAR
jgi:hypothetical protein